MDFNAWYEIRVYVNFLYVHSQWYQHCLLKRLFFPLVNCLNIIVKNQLVISVRVYFWSLNYIPVVFLSIFMPLPQNLHYCNFVVKFWNGKWGSLNLSTLRFFFFFFFNITLIIQGFLNSCWDSDKDSAVFINQFVENYHLYSTEYSHLQMWTVSLFRCSLILSTILYSFHCTSLTLIL